MISKIQPILKITSLAMPLLAFYNGHTQTVACTTAPQSITTTGSTQTINDITATLTSPTSAQNTRITAAGVNGYYIGDGSLINPEQINFALSEPVSSIVIIGQGLNNNGGTVQEKLIVTVNGVHHVVTPAEFMTPAPPPATATNTNAIDANGDIIGGMGGSSFMLTITGDISSFTIYFDNVGTLPSSGAIFDVRISSNCATVPLPLKLTSFTAAKAGTKALLQWATTTEENSRGFIVENSADGKTFMPLATLPAAGNSHTRQDYSYMHETPGSGSQYYRLKMTDMDGSSAYSPLSMVQFADNSNVFKIFPNPGDGHPLQIQLPVGNTFSSLGIYDYTGREALTSKSKNGTDISSLRAGLYLVRVLTTEGKVFRCELVKK